jgi:hypothetical protein
MKRVGRSIWPFLGLAVMLATACSRQPALLPSPSGGAQANPPPFENPVRSDGISPTQAFASTSIPAGTAIVVRLQSFLSSSASHSGQQFQAVLDGPIVILGQTLVPGGAAITGRVLVAKASQPHAPGYLRLTLSSVVLNGKAVDVHTSGVFSKGEPGLNPRSVSSSTKDVEFSTGRRLTFHLVQSLPLQG